MLEECKVMVLYPSVQEILQGGEAESKRFFQYQESICRWKIEALLQLKTKPGFNEGSRKLVKSQKKQIRFSFSFCFFLATLSLYLFVLVLFQIPVLMGKL